jgi:murein DD-endopeptidase MepM/ murein hydrolase activator NlpD
MAIFPKRVPTWVKRPIGILILSISLALAAAFLTTRAAGAQLTQNYVNINYWPLDAKYPFVIAYPDSSWTWGFLGINSGQRCPPYRLRSQDNSQQYWRDPTISLEDDWLQASQGREYVRCYQAHRGTDIAAQPGAPVYAVAEGVVHLAIEGSDSEGESGQVVIAHNRTVDGVNYTWQARYLHLRNFFPVTSGPVREGQFIGYVADRKSNTHLHFGVEGLWDCWSPCIQNPWGPVYLWIDDDFNRFPDPAPAFLTPAPERKNVLANSAFDTGDLAPWLARPGTVAQVKEGMLTLQRQPGMPGWSGIEQYIPYALDAGSPFEVSLRLGNTGDTTRHVEISLRSVQNPVTGYSHCTFALPPDTPLLSYWLRGRAGYRWSNFVLAVSISPADSKPAVIVDDVSVVYRPGMAIGPVGCGMAR